MVPLLLLLLLVLCLRLQPWLFVLEHSYRRSGTFLPSFWKPVSDSSSLLSCNFVLYFLSRHLLMYCFVTPYPSSANALIISSEINPVGIPLSSNASASSLIIFSLDLF